MRREKDFLGELAIEKEALYGINAMRACENFGKNHPFPLPWYRAMGAVKFACYRTYQKMMVELQQKYGQDFAPPFHIIKHDKVDALMVAAREITEEKHYAHFIVPAISGSAGTSFNMNINEIVANRALQILGKKPGQYEELDPFEDANIFQSTNDVVPTALKLAIMEELEVLEEEINFLRKEVENKETQYRNTLRRGFTEHQEAVPSSFGKLFSSYSDALSRDWWRVSKCFERIKIVNLGGTAIGTGVSVPRYFIVEVVKTLREEVNRPLTQGENLVDATCNLDSLVEVHAILKAHAVNFEKMVSDLRLLSSGLMDRKEVMLPDLQVGSSIMPGKVNPIIPEFIISLCHRVYSNDDVIARLAAQGTLELNPYLPMIGTAFLESLSLLQEGNRALAKLWRHLAVNEKVSKENLWAAPSVTTALIPYIGYHKATELAQLMKKESCDVFSANEKLQLLDKEQISEALSESRLLSLGFTLKEVLNAKKS